MNYNICFEVASKCSSFIDFVPGSDFEKIFLSHVLNLIDNPLLEYYFQPIEVLYWKDRYTVIEVNGKEYSALTLPITQGGVVKGKLTDDINDVYGKIYITYFPRDLDDAKFIYIDAVERGAIGVIFIDPRPDLKRRIVITMSRDYTWNTGKIPEIPAVTVDCKTGDELFNYVNKEITIVSDIVSEKRLSYNLIINVKESEENLLITAHYDHWLIGISDNCLGIGLLIQLLKELLNNRKLIENSRKGLIFTLFTAEEIGNPRYSTIYWAYGSKIFTNWLVSKKLIDNIHFVINIDVIGREVEVYASNDVIQFLKNKFLDLNYKNSIPYFDAQNFEIEGLPTITISALSKYFDVYHSTKDDLEHVNKSKVIESLEITFEIVKYLLNTDFDYSIYFKNLLEELDKLNTSLNVNRIDKSMYRYFKKIFSKFIVEYRKDNEVELKYINNIINYLKSLNYDEIKRVEIFGTGEVLIDLENVKLSNKLIENSISGILQELRYLI